MCYGVCTGSVLWVVDLESCLPSFSSFPQGFSHSLDSTSSVVLTCALMEGRIDPLKASHLTHLEMRHQVCVRCSSTCTHYVGVCIFTPTHYTHLFTNCLLWACLNMILFYQLQSLEFFC